MNKFKAVMCDLDNTLLRHGSNLTEASIEMIDRLIENDILFIPTTGRYLGVIPEFFHEHKGIEYIVSSNGAIVSKAKTSEILREVYIDKQTVYEMMEHAYDKAGKIILDTDDGVFADKRLVEGFKRRNDDFYNHLIKHNKIIDDILVFLKDDNVKIKKIDIGFDDLSYRDKLYDKFQSYKGVSVVSSNEYNIEITSSDATKGKALDFVVDYLGIDHDEIIAIGDNDNDISMLKKAGVGIAMGNASNHVKSHSDFVTLSVDENGFAYSMNKYFKFK